MKTGGARLIIFKEEVRRVHELQLCLGLDQRNGKAAAKKSEP